MCLMFHKLFHGDNLSIMKQMSDEMIHLFYIDPPYNTGYTQKRGDLSYDDMFPTREMYLSFLHDRFEQIYRLLKKNGSLFVHIDYRGAHYIKLMLDDLFGDDCFKNEIIWAYDYGARSKKRWSTKHDTILWYTKDPDTYTFNYDKMDRIPYMAPGLVGKEKADRGKTPTDVWWHTIVPTNGKEKTGYPTQKPLGVLERIVKVHSNQNDVLMDCFAGSGSFGEIAAIYNRNSILIEKNPDAIKIILKRMDKYDMLLA